MYLQVGLITDDIWLILRSNSAQIPLKSYISRCLVLKPKAFKVALSKRNASCGCYASCHYLLHWC